MASIAEWIEKIKTAIYGEEVRGAIWQSLDAMNTQVDAINVDSAQIETNKTNIATNTAAITALNSRFGIALGSNPNFDNIVGPGFYYFGDVANAVNPPNKDAGYLYMLVLKVGDIAMQVVFGGRQLLQGGRDKIWVRYRNGNSDSDWNRWIAYATQSEVDALEARVTALENK